MKMRLHVCFSDAEDNIRVTLQYTGVHYPTRTIVREVEIEVPDPPETFRLDRITVAQEQDQ